MIARAGDAVAVLVRPNNSIAAKVIPPTLHVGIEIRLLCHLSVENPQGSWVERCANLVEVVRPQLETVST